MNAPELKPCPFCGETNTLTVDNLAGDDWYVECGACKVQQHAIYPTLGAAMSAWNTRTAASPQEAPSEREAFEATWREYSGVPPNDTAACDIAWLFWQHRAAQQPPAIKQIPYGPAGVPPAPVPQLMERALAAMREVQERAEPGFAPDIARIPAEDWRAFIDAHAEVQMLWAAWRDAPDGVNTPDGEQR